MPTAAAAASSGAAAQNSLQAECERVACGARSQNGATHHNTQEQEVERCGAAGAGAVACERACSACASEWSVHICMVSIDHSLHMPRMRIMLMWVVFVGGLCPRVQSVAFTISTSNNNPMISPRRRRRRDDVIKYSSLLYLASRELDGMDIIMVNVIFETHMMHARLCLEHKYIHSTSNLHKYSTFHCVVSVSSAATTTTTATRSRNHNHTTQFPTTGEEIDR